MSTVSAVGTQSSAKTETKKNNTPQSFGQRFGQEFGMSMAFGLPLTGAMLTAPTWWKYAKMPYSAHCESVKNPDLTYGQAWKNVYGKIKADNKVFEFLTKDQSFLQGQKNKGIFSNIRNLGNEIPKFDAAVDAAKLEGADLIKHQNSQIASRYYAEAERLIKEAKDKKMTGKELKEQYQKILKAMQKGDYKVNYARKNGTLKPTGTIGKAKHWVKSKTGYYNLKSKLLSSTRTSNAMRMAAKGGKGMAIWAALGLVLEGFNLYAANECDKAEEQLGNKNSNHLKKQAVKSVVKTGAGILGYAAGSAATGAAIGSVFPGVGNVVGGILGFIGGTVAAIGAGYLADKAVGEKSEAELFAEKIEKLQKGENEENIDLESVEQDLKARQNDLAQNTNPSTGELDPQYEGLIKSLNALI